MAVDIHKIIAAIVPDVYCDQEVKSEVKSLVKQKGYLAAAEKAKPVPSDYMDLDKQLFAGTAYKLDGLKNPIEKHSMEYDNFAGNTLEQIYFWLLDYINKEYDSSDKLVDNFSSATGSAHFGDMTIRMSQLQQTAQRNFELANTVIKSLINLVYDLKDFKLKLADYSNRHSKNSDIRKAAILSLKERWMDQVDARRGQASIRSLTSQLDFVTLLNGFMASNSLEDVKKIDLNDIVRNVLMQRLSEFFKWVDESEKQLKTRYELEKKYLKTQADSIKLYSRWAKPYLQAIKQLEQNQASNSALVTVFETTMLELTLLGKKRYIIEPDISMNNLPKSFRKFMGKNYQYFVVLELKFRSSPQKSQYAGGFTFRGKVYLEMTSYALTENELKVLKEEVEKNDFGDLMSLIGGSTEGSLDTMQDDIKEFLEEEKKEVKKESNNVNPFTALFSSSKKEKKNEGVTKDSDPEKAIRNQAIIKGRLECRKFYNAFKGSYDMPSFF